VLMALLLAACPLAAIGQEPPEQSHSYLEQLQSHFFEGADHYVGLTIGPSFPRKSFKDRDGGAAGTGMSAQAEMAWLFAKYIGIGLAVPFHYHPVPLGVDDVDTAFNSFSSEAWRGAGFCFGPVLSIPVHPVVIEFHFFPGYLQYRYPVSKGIVTENGSDFLISRTSDRDGAFAFHLSGGVRFEPVQGWNISLSAQRYQAKFRFKDVEAQVDGALLDELEIEQRLDVLSISLGVMKTF